MDDIKAKQQIIEKIKESTNILVTVSDNPTVDALSAAIGLTLLIDKLDKHGTAIFSGVVPPATPAIWTKMAISIFTTASRT